MKSLEHFPIKVDRIKCSKYLFERDFLAAS
ncbi:hypothetical protein AQ1_00313 [alpha proteobacterium Q-1]|nr:hypothetical protein AQ1_00313 [alpha proteobacterium Q-1]